MAVAVVVIVVVDVVVVVVVVVTVSAVVVVVDGRVEEGVLLLRLGCDVVQGYGIARPMPAEQVLAWAMQFQLDPQWRLWADVKWALTDLPLLLAQQDHEEWVKRVILATQGVSQTQLPDLHQCGFGHWFDGPGQQRYGDMPEFQAIRPMHLQVHALGEEILQLHADGQIEAAAGLCAELLACKDQLLDLLKALQQAGLVKIARTEPRA